MGEAYEAKQAQLAREGKLPPPEPKRDYYTSREIADRCGVTLSTVTRWINWEGLVAEKRGNRWFIPKEEFMQFVIRRAEADEYQQKERAAHSYGQYLIRRRQWKG